MVFKATNSLLLLIEPLSTSGITNIDIPAENEDSITKFGDGLSAGFRWDYALSNKSGIAIGAEQLIDFDGKTDTGRDIYLTTSF